MSRSERRPRGRPEAAGRVRAVVAALAAVPVLATGCGEEPPTVAAGWEEAARCGPDRVEGEARWVPAPEGLAGVRALEGPAGSVRSGCVTFRWSPPVLGDRSDRFANCGFHDEVVPSVHALRSMEHGAVWITYRPDVGAPELARIRRAATTASHVLASPVPDLRSPVVMSAWGRQLELDATTDPRFDDFLDLYVQGPQTPVEGGACHRDGVGNPVADVTSPR